MAGGDNQLVRHVNALMKALEDGAFKKAEALIKDAGHPDCLNVHDHRSSPLIQVLCGKANYLNFYLTELLSQYGANVRNRLYYDIYPLESAIKMYLDVTALCDEQETCNSPSDIELDCEINPPPLRVKEQLLALIDNLLATGATPNFLLDVRRRSIFHEVVAYKNTDIDLVMKLYRWGGNFNQGDVNGTTPLMDCISRVKSDKCFPLIDRILCEVPDLDINHTNHKNETMFSRAVAAGSPNIAVRLLQYGADPTIDVVVSNDSRNSTYISPIFLPLLRWSSPYASLPNNSGMGLCFNIPSLNKVMLSSVFPVVDRTDICDSICAKLERVLSLKTNFPLLCLTDWEYCTRDVGILMLGHFKAGLQQMCVRTIMEHLIVKQPCLWKDIVEAATWLPLRNSHGQHSLVKQLCPLIIGILRRELGLPARLERRFFIEAARLQMGSWYFWF